MAIEGGKAYRNSLIRRQENKKNLIKLRNKDAANPMRWTNLLDKGKDEEAYIAYLQSAQKAGLSEDAYGNLIDTAYRQGGALEGLTNPTVSNYKLDLSRGKALEGLMGYERKPVMKAGVVRADQGFGGSLSNIMQGIGDQRWVLNRDKRAQNNIDTLKAIAKYVKEDPWSATRSTAYSFVSPFANIAAEATGNNDVYAFMKANPEYVNSLMSPLLNLGGNVKGDMLAAEPMFKNYATPEDYAWAAATFSPQTYLKVIKGLGKAGLVGARAPGAMAGQAVGRVAGAAVRHPKTAIALGAGGGVMGYSAFSPDEAEALDLSRLAKLGGLSSQAGRKYINEGWKNAGNRAARKIIKQFSDEQPFSGLGRNEFLKEKGLYQTAGEANPVDLLTTYIEANPTMTDNIVEFAHDISKAKGGPHTRDNVYFIPKRTNAAMKELTFKEFVEDQMKLTGKSADEVAKEWGILHTSYK